MFYECMRNPHRGNLWEINVTYNHYKGWFIIHATPVAVPGPPVRGRDSRYQSETCFRQLKETRNPKDVARIR